MPKNTGKGGNKRKKGKKQVQEDRELRFRDESEEYAQITKILGDGRFQCKCADGVDRIAHVRGKLRKRTWLANGDIILVSLREFEPEKCDVVEKYKEKEVAKLKSKGEIPETMVLPSVSEEKNENVDEGDIFFEDQDTNNIDIDTKKKKEQSNNGFDIDSEENEEDEENEKEEDKKENVEEKEEKEEKKEEKEDVKEKEEIKEEKEKKSKKDKKEKDRKRKNNRDKKRGDKEEEDKGFNIDDI